MDVKVHQICKFVEETPKPFVVLRMPQTAKRSKSKRVSVSSTTNNSIVYERPKMMKEKKLGQGLAL